MKKNYIYGIIIAVLLVVVGFLLINNNEKDNAVNNNETNDNTALEVESVRYYQHYDEVSVDGQDESDWKSQEIELNSDGSAKWYYGGTTSGGAEYEGTYKEDNNSIIMTLNLKTESGEKCDDNVSVNSCKLTLTLKKDGTNKLIDNDEDYTHTYNKTTKSTLKLIK